MQTYKFGLENVEYVNWAELIFKKKTFKEDMNTDNRPHIGKTTVKLTRRKNNHAKIHLDKRGPVIANGCLRAMININT